MKKIQFGMTTDQGVQMTDGYEVANIPWASLVVHSADDGWRVIEPTSGGNITRGHKLRNVAVATAVSLLNQKGETEFKKLVAAFIEAHAPKPQPAPPAKAPAKQEQPMTKQIWPKIGQIVRVIYGKRYPNMPLHMRHARVLEIAKRRPMNALCMLRGGKTVVIPIGNLVV